VIASQHARRTVDKALRKGRHTSWDHQPFDDATGQYMRNHLDLNAVEASRRLR
jgi:choline-sulfatase